MSSPQRHLALVSCVLSLSGCDATLGGSAPGVESSDPDGASSDRVTETDPFAPLAEGCEDEPSLVEPPLRRLTNLEYERTVTRLFGVEAPGAAQFPIDESTAGFKANWVSAVGDKHVADYQSAAEAIAARILELDPTLLRVCADAPAQGENCVTEQLTRVTELAYRRPVEEDELTALLAFHEAQEIAWGPDDADRMALEALFQSPQFLYISPGYPGRQLEALANRLAYFLTGHPPDATLLLRASSGDLVDQESLESEVDRLLASEDSTIALLSFFTQWLDLERLEQVAKDESVYGTWSEALRHDMFDETALFVESIVSEGGGLPELLTSRRAWVSPVLADLYGVAGQHSGTGFEEIQLPEGQRAGLLTQASFLAGHSHQVENSWVLRGDFVRRHLLCDELPPPPDVDLSNINDAGRLDDPSCANCHILMDPIGQSFDRYDALGRFRTADAGGAEIATNGQLHPGPEPLDISGPFESPLTLAESLSTSDSVHACLSRQMFRFAHRRLDAEGESCGLLQIAEHFSSSGGDLKTLMRALALSPAMIMKKEDNR